MRGEIEGRKGISPRAEVLTGQLSRTTPPSPFRSGDCPVFSSAGEFAYRHGPRSLLGRRGLSYDHDSPLLQPRRFFDLPHIGRGESDLFGVDGTLSPGTDPTL